MFDKIRLFQSIFNKISIFNSNCSFTATSGPIILFLFKSYHFRTCFLYMITYNNISRPVHDPHDPLRPHDSLPKIWGSRPPTPRIYASEDLHTYRQSGRPTYTDNTDIWSHYRH